MSSTTVKPVATLIANVIAGLSVTFPGGSASVKAYTWDPGMDGFDALPAGVVGVPDIRRVSVDSPESQIGSRDWRMTYPVTFVFDLDVAALAQDRVVDCVEAFIKAIDTDTLQASDGSIIDAKVIAARPNVVMTDARPLLAYDCELELLKLV